VEKSRKCGLNLRLSLGSNSKWNNSGKSIKLVLVVNYKVYTIDRTQINAGNNC